MGLMDLPPRLQTAERALEDAVGPAPERYFVGNSPAAHFRVSDQGPLLFLHRAQYIGGEVRGMGPSVADWAWVPQGELGNYLKDRQLLDLLAGLLKN